MWRAPNHARHSLAYAMMNGFDLDAHWRIAALYDG
jgi:hypothetical protein